MILFTTVFEEGSPHLLVRSPKFLHSQEKMFQLQMHHCSESSSSLPHNASYLLGLYAWPNMPVVIERSTGLLFLQGLLLISNIEHVSFYSFFSQVQILLALALLQFIRHARGFALTFICYSFRLSSNVFN